MVALPRDGANMLVAKRDYVTCDATGCYYSPWYSWQRWVVLGALLVFTALLLLLCACLSARRRRSRGLSPYYGTAWAAPPAYDVNSIPQNHQGTGPQYGGYTYASHQQTPFNPPGSPPVYSPPTNAGYYGQQQSGTTYTGGPNYELDRVGGSSGPYLPPRPEEAHKR